MIDKKQLIDELLECVQDATDTDTETKITGLTMCAALFENVLDEAINYNHCCKRDSEQLCDCDAPLIRTSGKRGEYCGICQKDLD